jgi:ubiquinone/menaquinone biosynthesis C-methylase UbiE
MNDREMRPKSQYYDACGTSYEGRRYGNQGQRLYFEMRMEALDNVILMMSQPGVRLDILEVACGTGLTLQQLCNRWGSRHCFTGMDASPTMLKQSEDKAAQLEHPPKLCAGAAPNLPFPDKSFDLLYATRFIYMFSAEERIIVIRDFLRVLKDQGVLVLEFYAPNVARNLQHWLHPKEARDASRYVDFSNVKSLMGGNVQIVPLRIAGAGLLTSVIGSRFVRSMTRLVSRTPYLGLYDYLAIAAKADIPLDGKRVLESPQ